MLTNMMFYGVVPDSDTSGELGGFTFNYGQVRCFSFHDHGITTVYCVEVGMN